MSAPPSSRERRARRPRACASVSSASSSTVQHALRIPPRAAPPRQRSAPAGSRPPARPRAGPDRCSSRTIASAISEVPPSTSTRRPRSRARRAAHAGAPHRPSRRARSERSTPLGIDPRAQGVEALELRIHRRAACSRRRRASLVRYTRPPQPATSSSSSSSAAAQPGRGRRQVDRERPALERERQRPAERGAEALEHREVDGQPPRAHQLEAALERRLARRWGSRTGTGSDPPGRTAGSTRRARPGERSTAPAPAAARARGAARRASAAR